MRIVDEETRRLVMQNRIDALEADNLYENHLLDPEDELDDDVCGEGGRKRDGGYSGEYVVEEEEESEDISEDGDALKTTAEINKAKANKRKEKQKQKALT